ncbi:MAG: class I SAM-dependent methyltransferase [Desulfamplus sp.]|nr:class I SAM-dependent methyltransferase [Desulfamplus sp.]
MELNEYSTMFNVEDDLWWYRGLRALIFKYITNYFVGRKGLKLLDAGCGTGAFLSRCRNYKSTGIDLSGEAVRFCKQRGLGNVGIASITNIPFSSSIFDIVVSCDVLCQLAEGHDEATLEEFNRVLKPGGVLILNLPAFEALKSSHDKAVHIKHRYTRSEVTKKIKKAGFEVEKISYRNFFLFPVAVVVRLVKKIFTSQEDLSSDLSLPHPTINKLLTCVLAIENKIMPGGDFPVGLSVFCVAVKK